MSVVTPCRNAVRWLPACLDSVAAQTYPHVEHLVMDAASADGTVALLESRPGVEWTSEPDRGQSDALRKGFLRVRGSVMTWLNADDTLQPDAVEKIVRALAADPHVGLVAGGAVIVEGGRTRITRPPSPLRLRDLDRANPIAQPSCFFTRAAYDRVGGLDPELHLTMDLDLWLRMLRAGVRPVILSDILSRIVVHEGAKTSYVSPEAWFQEFGVARLKNDRLLPAAVSFGRAATHRVAADGVVRAAALRAELARLAAEYPVLPKRGLLAGAYAEAMVLEARSGRLPRHALPPLSLLTAETARELGSALSGRLSRRRPGKPRA